MNSGSLYRAARHRLGLLQSLALNVARLRRSRAREGAGRRVVAVLLLEHLGDIVACEPVARYLKEQDPTALLAWGVKPAYRELVDANPHIDLTLPMHCLSERLLIAGPGRIDQVHDLHLPGRHCSLCRTPLQRPRDTVVGLDNYLLQGGILTSFAVAGGLPPLREAPKVYIPRTVVARVDALGLPRRFVAVCASSNSPAKDWTPGKWLALAAHLQSDPGLAVVELGLRPAVPAGGRQSIDCCGRLTILESAEVIRRAELFVGVDSGPAHLANAVGTPGVVLIGSFLGFSRYQPFTGLYATEEGAEIVRAEGPAAEISVSEVVDAARGRLARARSNPVREQGQSR